ncbi:MAG TPA: hypothetical protein VF033_06855, partial [Steroidobacteraceae bacterium]
MSHDPASRLESLLKLAGERDQPSPPALARARAAAHARWQRSLQSTLVEAANQPRRRAIATWMAGGAAAALLLAAWWPSNTPSAQVARVAAVDGDVRRTSGEAIAADDPVHGAEVLHTAHGRVALTFGDALSLRLDRNTQLRIEGPSHVTLLSGSVYVDSGGLNARAPLRIDT